MCRTASKDAPISPVSFGWDSCLKLVALRGKSVASPSQVRGKAVNRVGLTRKLNHVESQASEEQKEKDLVSRPQSTHVFLCKAL